MNESNFEKTLRELKNSDVGNVSALNISHSKYKLNTELIKSGSNSRFEMKSGEQSVVVSDEPTGITSNLKDV